MAISLVFAVAAISAIGQTLDFTGNSLKVLEEIPEKSTGLEKIYVAYSVKGVSVSYTSQSGNKVNWLKYSNLGGGYAEEVESVQSGDKSTLSQLEGDMGYIVEDGDRRYGFWIVDYLPHRLKLEAVSISEESECGVAIINVAGTGSPIHYFTVNGRQMTLNQDITVGYNTQEWNEDAENFIETKATESFASLQASYRITPPNYCPTTFIVSGDKFLKAWNWAEEVESEIAYPHSVDARTFAVQRSSGNSEAEEGSNQIGSSDGEGLGGSAPCDISFEAFATDGIIHHEWQLTRDPSFENIDFRFNTQDLDYSFIEDGSHYVRYIGSNSDGSCEYIGDVYEVTVGESQLLVPNAFSPNGDGVNDEWKVAYRSLLSFNCWIFDRQGHQICHLSSPEQGWDGKIGGRTVESGVFFYVIEATGTNGKKFKKSGDINIVKYVGVKGSTAQ